MDFGLAPIASMRSSLADANLKHHRVRCLTDTCLVAHTSGDNYIRSLTSPGGVGVGSMG